MLRDQKIHFVSKKKGKRVFSHSGGSLLGHCRLENRINEFTRQTNSDTKFFVQVCTNDLLNKKSRNNSDRTALKIQGVDKIHF